MCSHGWSVRRRGWGADSDLVTRLSEIARAWPNAEELREARSGNLGGPRDGVTDRSRRVSCDTDVAERFRTRQKGARGRAEARSANFVYVP